MSASPPNLPPVAIVVSVYNATVTTRLLEGAIAEFVHRGGDRKSIRVYEVHGAFEIPVVAESVAGMFVRDWAGGAVVCLGCIIKGDTRHDEILGDVVTQELSSIATRHRVPIGLGVLTVNTPEQAEARAGGDKGNKGQEAMAAALDAWGALEAIRTSKQSFTLTDLSPDKVAQQARTH